MTVNDLRDERWRIHPASLKAAYAHRGLSAAEVGRRALVSGSLTRSLANGSVTSTTGVTLRSICAVLQVAPSSVADRIER